MTSRKSGSKSLTPSNQAGHTNQDSSVTPPPRPSKEARQQMVRTLDDHSGAAENGWTLSQGPFAPQPQNSESADHYSRIITCKECTGHRERLFCALCDLCKNYFCDDCCDLDHEALPVLAKSAALRWFCSSCIKPARGDYIVVKNRKEDSEDDDSDEEQNHEPRENTITGAISPELLTTIVTAATEAATKAVMNMTEDLLEKREKRHNLVVVGLPENETSEQQQETADLRKMKDYCTQMRVPPESIKCTFRDGPRKSNTTKPRIMKICFHEGKGHYRTTFLKNANGLLKADEDLRGLRFTPFVRRDLTYRERQEDRALRDLLKTRKDNGETDLIIRNGKIIKRTSLIFRSPSSRISYLGPPSSRNNREQHPAENF